MGISYPVPDSPLPHFISALPNKSSTVLDSSVILDSLCSPHLANDYSVVSEHAVASPEIGDSILAESEDNYLDKGLPNALFLAETNLDLGSLTETLFKKYADKQVDKEVRISIMNPSNKKSLSTVKDKELISILSKKGKTLNSNSEAHLAKRVKFNKNVFVLEFHQ